jgi:hypothetical protein
MRESGRMVRLAGFTIGLIVVPVWLAVLLIVRALGGRKAAGAMLGVTLEDTGHD